MLAGDRPRRAGLRWVSKIPVPKVIWRVGFPFLTLRRFTGRPVSGDQIRHSLRLEAEFVGPFMRRQVTCIVVGLSINARCGNAASCVWILFQNTMRKGFVRCEESLCEPNCAGRHAEYGCVDVRKREVGDQKPSGPSRELLSLIERKGSRQFAGAARGASGGV